MNLLCCCFSCFCIVWFKVFFLFFFFCFPQKSECIFVFRFVNILRMGVPYREWEKWWNLRSSCKNNNWNAIGNSLFSWNRTGIAEKLRSSVLRFFFAILGSFSYALMLNSLAANKNQFILLKPFKSNIWIFPRLNRDETFDANKFQKIGYLFVGRLSVRKANL